MITSVESPKSADELSKMLVEAGIEQVAWKHLGISTLEDFSSHQCTVVDIKNALMAAYNMGKGCRL